MQYELGHLSLRWTYSIDMDMQHGQAHDVHVRVHVRVRAACPGNGHAAWTWAFSMEMDMQHGHRHAALTYSRHAAWTEKCRGYAARAGGMRHGLWTCSMNMDVDMDKTWTWTWTRHKHRLLLDQRGQLRTLFFKGFAEELAEVSKN
jgi:hypothetical protein